MLEVEFDDVGSLVRGHGSRELVTEVTGRPPMWRTLARGWSVQEHTARDVVALAERRNYDIVVLGPRATRQRRQDDRQVFSPEHLTPTPMPESEGLW
ncbi:hypothetical protein [Nocardioides sp. CFH 31398]|uniref:hypothetical protein n=1 Tax=Nocardioides sp. CFH 31398 TaxID=2919579 RepID=UPI001F070815|nr:hypothetical protein [Nocardioides sp. CFH 31398]MCH1867075.1 hypothetical protein [Nocardioides sp. CFH 31398]